MHNVLSKEERLSFNKGNAKLGDSIYTFSLPAGYTCPGALKCLAFADRTTGRITDGNQQQFRCFAASDEARHSSVRKSRWRNYDLLKKASNGIEPPRLAMDKLISASLPTKAKTIRIHVSGDFFNEDYFLAWTDVARRKQLVTFYAYTKSLNVWRKWEHLVPDNLILTASLGGKYDAVSGGLKTARVVYTESQAESFGLEIDHDDSHAYNGTKSFALLLHGTQKAGTPAASALKDLRSQGITGYSTKKKAA